MAVPVVRRRNEGRVLRPFRGLEGIDDLVAGAHVLVNTVRGPGAYRLNQPFKCPGRLLASAEIKVDIRATQSELLAAVERLGVPAEAVSLVVMARDLGVSPLKETVVLSVTPLTALDRPVEVCTSGDTERARPLRNRHDGFSLVIQFVLDRDLPAKPLTPHLKGTILSGGTWDAISTDARSGIQPQPLTQEVRNRHLLPAAVWFFVEKIDSYLEAPNLREAFTVYVEEQYLRNLAFLPTEPRRLAEHLFIVPALVSVVSETARELQSLPDDGTLPDRSGSAVLEFLHQKTARVSADRMSFEDFVDMLKTEPGRVVGMITGTNDIRKKLLDVTESLAGGDE